MMTIQGLKSHTLRLASAIIVLAVGFSVTSVSQAQTFKQIPSLSFTKPFGGANPLPQVLNLVSTGAEFNFSASATTTTGGTWLQISPTGVNCCITPEVMRVTVNAPASLAVGTYQGQITFTSYPSATHTMTVAVSLTVAPANGTFFDNEPGQLSFSIKTADSVPPAQTFQILNGGSGTLMWNLAASTSDGGSWLSVTSVTGTAPEAVTVGILPASLPGGGGTAGTFVGQLVLTTAGSEVTIPVSVVVGDSVFMQINPLNFTMPFGGANPLSQVLAVSSTGSAFNFSAAVATGKGGSWLQTSPTGVNCCITPEVVRVNVIASSLPVGIYTGEIILTQYGSATVNNNMAITVPVTLTVTRGGTSFFDSMPGELSFSMQTAGIAPPAQKFQIGNGGSGTLAWTLVKTTADGGNWLTVSAASGTAPTVVTIGITPAMLPGGAQLAGTFVGQVLLVSSSSRVTIPISVVVGDSVFRQVNPINFTMPFGGSNPLPQILNIASTGAAFNYSAAATTSKGGSWLQVSPSGVNCCITPEVMQVSVTASTLAAGVYTGEIVLTQYGAATVNNNMAITVPVTLTVAASGSAFFDSLAGQLSFAMKTAGHAPPAQVFQIRNGGAGALNWTLSKSTADGGNWLTVSPTSGTAPTLISVAIVPGSLPGGGQLAGNFVGQVLIESSGSTVTVPVSVVVGDSVFTQVNPINFTMPFGGGNPLPQILSIASTGSQFNYSAVAATGKGGNWLTVAPTGVNCCITPEAMRVTVNASTLAVGIYSGEITLTQYGAATVNNNMAITVPVTLTVAASGTPFFDNTPGQLSFSMKTMGKVPPAQAFQIRNGGTGALTWTATKSTADGANWMTISATTGTAPTILSVGIVAASLPGAGKLPGTFTGQVLISSAASTVTIPVSVVVGDSVFVQVNPINFTMPVGGPNPLPQILTMASTGTEFNYSTAVATGKGGSWLTIAPTGVNCCITPESMRVTVSASTLTAGTYTAEITFTQYGAATVNNNMAITVPVTLTVAASGTAFFDNTLGQLSFSMKPGTAPPAHTFQIRNGGAGTLSWTLTKSTADGGNWLTVTPATGKAPTVVTAKVALAALPGKGQIAGTFTGQVLISTATGSVTVPVSVIVRDPVFVQLNSVAFSAKAGTNPVTQTITVASSGAAFNFSAVAATGKGGNWLTISPTGVNCCVTPKAITMTVKSSSLAVGTYTGEITFTQYGSASVNNNTAMTVPVVLTVK